MDLKKIGGKGGEWVVKNITIKNIRDAGICFIHSSPEVCAFWVFSSFVCWTYEDSWDAGVERKENPKIPLLIWIELNLNAL